MYSVTVLFSALAVAAAKDSTVQWFAKGVGGAASTELKLGGGHISENMPGWPSLPDSKFFSIPESQELIAAYIPEHKVTEDSYIRMHCADSPTIDFCDFFVNIYRCADCTEAQTDNKLVISNMISSGFTASSCAPKFITKIGGDVHKFITLRKQVPKGTTETLEFDHDVDLVFFGLSLTGVDCPSLSAAKCEEGKNLCKVVGGVCVDNWCPKVFQGPCPAPCTCQNCALNEIP